jgi:uncharacterized ParB-like nuclease family protein
MDVRLDLVMVDAAIQQRAIDDEVVSRYMALMQDGVEFPPIELVFDGKDYWLWNGFHRYQCAKKLKQTEITARVKNGSKRDALWLSFSANKDHGFRRQSGVAKRIIERILIDKVWSKKSLTAIAEHVGVTRVYVSQIKNELSAHGVNSLHDRNGESGVSEAETDTDETTNRTAERS